MDIGYIKKVIGQDEKKAIVAGGNSGAGESAAVSHTHIGAGAAARLVTDAFRYMTGSTISAEGGLKLRNVRINILSAG